MEELEYPPTRIHADEPEILGHYKNKEPIPLLVVASKVIDVIEFFGRVEMKIRGIINRPENNI